MPCASCEPHPASAGQAVPSPTALSLQALARLTQELGRVNVEGEGAAGTPLDELVSVDTNSGLQGSGRMSFLSLIHFLV